MRAPPSNNLLLLQKYFAKQPFVVAEILHPLLKDVTFISKPHLFGIFSKSQPDVGFTAQPEVYLRYQKHGYLVPRRGDSDFVRVFTGVMIASWTALQCNGTVLHSNNNEN